MNAVNSFNKTDLVEAIAKKSCITKVQALAEINHVFEGIEDMLKEIAKGKPNNKGEIGNLQVTNYFNFEVSHKPEYTSRNPRTKESVTVPAKNRVKANLGKLLKNSVN